MEKETLKRNSKELGLFAEGIARKYLTNNGYRILTANLNLGFGEIDIIAQKNGIIIFFEVKANSKLYEGFEPELKVDRKKRNKLIKLANAYLLNENLQDAKWQIDIISIILDQANRKARIRHFKNAIEE